MAFLSDLWRRNPPACAALLIGVVAAFRIAVVIASPSEISPDEAQYWRWAQTLDFGYYSKPPLIAWIIALSTAIFGDSEWAIRIFAPALHGVGAFFLFLLGRRMFTARIGAWAAAIYLLTPGIGLSSAIITTDAVLLPASAMAMYFLWRFREAPAFGNAALAGALIGLSMLGKYAALYLYGGVAIAAALDRNTRKALVSPAGAVLILASLVVLAPNLWWNIANDFATVSHTADNANLASAGFDPSHILTYLQDQAALFGPVTLLLLLGGCFFLAGRTDPETSAREVWLIGFFAPAMLVILTQEIMSRAHANWTASSIPSASILLAAWIDRAFGRLKVSPLLKTGLAVNAIIGLLFNIFWIFPGLADAANASSAMKGVRGWRETTDQLAARARQLDASAIMVDDREIWHALDYYGRNRDMPPLRAWQRGPSPRSHAEQAGRIQPGEDGGVLIASSAAGLRTMIRADFASIRELGYLEVPISPRRKRELKLFLGSGYAQAPRTAEFEAKHRGVREE